MGPTKRTKETFEQLIPAILDEWERRAKAQVLSATRLDSLELRDSMPKLLAQIVGYLTSVKDIATMRARQDQPDGLKYGEEHGAERAELMHYTMDQTVLEYHILRRVIFDLTRPKLSLSGLEQEIILCAVEQAVNAAATTFNSHMKSMQERLAQSFTHDLRSPLTAARMSAERIASLKDRPERCVEQASRVLSGLDRLDQMIEDLLDSSLVQAGRPLTLEFRSCDLRDICACVRDTARDAYGDRFVLKADGSFVARWSEQAVYRILQNLVTNAVKYGAPDAPITICMSRREDRAQLEVHNQGEPIAQKDWAILFEPYQQGHAHRRQGYGLGLSVVKGLVESHGGTVRVESAANTGTKFVIDLVSAPKQ